MRLIRSATTFALVALLMGRLVLAQKPAAGDLPEAGEGNPPKTEKVAYLGITTKSIDAALRTQLDLPEDTGLVVMTVDQNGPMSADLRVNDVLSKMDDQVLVDSHQFAALIHLHKPGDKVTLNVIRRAKAIQLSVRLGEKVRVVPEVVKSGPDPTLEIPDLPPGINSPDEPLPHVLFDPKVPLGQGNQTAMSFSDDTYSAVVKPDTQGRRHMIVKNSSGQVIAQGPVDTEEEWLKIAPEVRQHLEIMHKALGLVRKK